MTDPNHHIPTPRSEEDNDSEKDFAAQHLIGHEEPLITQNDTHDVKALPRRTPEDLVFTSTTIAPSPPPPTLCAPSQLRTALSSLNTAQQRYSGASSPDSSPVSASRLRVQRSFTSRPPELDASDTNQERRASKAIPIARTPSIKQVLASSFGSNSYTGSAPNSALSSPQLNAMPDLTPLPSPIMSNDSPGPWRRRISRSEYNESRTAPLTGDTALVTPNGELIPSAIANESKRRAYHGLLLNSEDVASKPSSYKREIQNSTHARNRSLSEYTPDHQAPKKRQQSVSGTYPKDMLPDHAPPVDSHMRREPNLALQRGIAPVPRPPTSPSSRTGGESSESDSAASSATKPIVKDYRKRSKHIYFDAVTIADNRKRRWRALKLLGEGTFSKVVLATSQLEKDSNTVDEDDVSLPDNGATEAALTEADTKKLVAVKICEHGPKGGASEERVEISLKRELELMKSIHHPSLVELQAWSMEESRAILVLGYCPGGDLFEVASQRPSILGPSLLQRVFAEIVSAIQYLHERHIVHRDIKLENVLVNLPHTELTKPTDWSTYPYSVITVTDLGLARYVTDDEKLTTRCGSDDYAAPEVIMGQPYDGRAVDAWSLGVLLYALLESRLPFDPNPGLSEGHKQRSRTSHRIARVEWRWVMWEGEDGDHEADEAKFEAAGLKTAMEITENLLKRARSRWTVDRVAQIEWVKSAIRVDGGIRFRNEEEVGKADDIELL
ncbi:CAMK protein kinase [Pseudogymnoascus sp. 24MN13]|nr:CAMK protein kinase [Pseudogymnoascus sp. 24MN13]